MPSAPDGLLETLADFATQLTRPHVVDEALQALAERVTDALDLLAAAIDVRHAERTLLVGTPCELAPAFEALQLELPGPSAEAKERCAVVVVPDLPGVTGGERHPWAPYRSLAAEVGIASVAVVPMVADCRVIGALSLYQQTPYDWPAGDLRLIRVLADMTTGYLVQIAEYERQRQTAEQLQRALDSRVVIEQAKGILAATNSVPIADSFKLLRKHARDHNATMQQVADAVVHLGLRI